MKKFNYLFILGLFLGLVSFKNTNTLSSYKINADYSKILWTGYKIGGEHKGELKFSDGEMLLEEDKLVGGNLVVDMKSLSCTDLEDSAQNDKLVGHLKSPDFFGVEANPTAKLKIKKAYSYGPYDTRQEETTGERFKVIADITIKGITKEIKFESLLISYAANSSKVLSANLKIDRSDFDIKYGSGNFFEDLGDKLIYDEVDLNINLYLTGA